MNETFYSRGFFLPSNSYIIIVLLLGHSCSGCSLVSFGAVAAAIDSCSLVLFNDVLLSDNIVTVL